MSCVSSLSEYLLKVLTSVSGMKALLLDKETAPMTAIVLSQTDVINKEVFLTERIDMDGKGLSDGYPKLNHRGEIESQSPSKESFHHLRAVAIIRPCQASVDRLGQVMRSGKFKDYYIFFTNIADEELLKSLAQYDEFELIRQVTEIYGDYFALSDFVYHANLFSTKQLYALPGASHSPTFERNSEAIISLLLSFKVRPDIRYAGSSKLAKSIAVDVARRIEKENDLFTFQTQSPLLIVMDRVDDPVTPLLTQWTYQAMVHELMGIDNNRVSLANAPGVKKDLQEVVMSPHQDHFYKGSQYLNFGDLGTSVKELVTNFQRKTQNHAKLDSIEDMQRFVDNYPEFRSMSGTVSKHVAIMTELSRIVESRQLMRLSELEQELACNQDHTYAMDTLLVILDDPRIDFDDKLRLVCLYALRYENDRHQIPVFERLLRDRAQMDSDKLAKIRCVKALLAHAGSRQRGGDLFGNKDIWSKANKMLKSGLKGVDNIYTQHKPLLTETLALLAQNRLKTQDYPFTESRLNSGKNSNANKYRLIIIYMIGGITYEETLAVENFNNASGHRHMREECRGECGGRHCVGL